MRRWTDGRCWSASRVSGCFLTYRELQVRKHRNGAPGGPTTNQYKTDGLIKQSFSMTTGSGRKMHVISYYTKSDVYRETLKRISADDKFDAEKQEGWKVLVDENEFPDPALMNQAQDGELMEQSELDQAEEQDGSGTSEISPKLLLAQAHHARVDSLLNNNNSTDATAGKLAPIATFNATPLAEARGLLPIDPIPIRPNQFRARSDAGEEFASRKRPLLSQLQQTIGAHLPPLKKHKQQQQMRLNDGSISYSSSSQEAGSDEELPPSLPQTRPLLKRLRSSSDGFVSEIRANSFQSNSSHASSAGSMTSEASSSSKGRSGSSNTARFASEDRSTGPTTPDDGGGSVIGQSPPTMRVVPGSAVMLSSKSEQESAIGALLSLSTGTGSAQASPMFESSEKFAASGHLTNGGDAPVRVARDADALSKLAVRL